MKNQFNYDYVNFLRFPYFNSYIPIKKMSYDESSASSILFMYFKYYFLSSTSKWRYTLTPCFVNPESTIISYLDFLRTPSEFLYISLEEKNLMSYYSKMGVGSNYDFDWLLNIDISLVTKFSYVSILPVPSDFSEYNFSFIYDFYFMDEKILD